MTPSERRSLLPERPESHVLETAQFNAFIALLPPEWTWTEPRGDYGVDLRVELFERSSDDGRRRATGREFGVQLKATDSESFAAMSIGVEWGTLAYWQLLSYPVLVVRYHRPSGRQFAMWVHERRRMVEEPTKQAWFRFRDADFLSEQRWPEIAAEIETYRSVFTRSLRLPLRIRCTGTRMNDLFAARTTAWFNRELGIGRIEIGAGDGDVSLIHEENRAAVDPGGPAGVHWWHEGADVLPQDIGVLLGLAIGRCGQRAEGAELIWRSRSSALLADPEFLWLSVRLCTEVAKPDWALDLLDASPDCDLALDLASDVLIAVHKTHRHELIAARLTSYLELAVSRSAGSERSGRAELRLALHLRRMQLHDRAVKCFKRSARAYESIPSFWYEYAGSLFLSGRFAQSANAYQRAAVQGALTEHHLGCWAEALIHSGKYKPALELLASVPLEGERLLLHCVAATALNASGGTQRRSTEKASTLYYADQSNCDSVTLAMNALRHDALFGPAWQTLIFAAFEETPDSAGLPMLIAAYIADSDGFLWAHALCSITRFRSSSDQLIDAVARRAWMRANVGFEHDLLELIDGLSNPTDATDAMPAEERERVLTALRQARDADGQRSDRASPFDLHGVEALQPIVPWSVR